MIQVYLSYFFSDDVSFHALFPLASMSFIMLQNSVKIFFCPVFVLEIPSVQYHVAWAFVCLTVAMVSMWLLALTMGLSLFGKSRQQTSFVFCEETTQLSIVWNRTPLHVFSLQVELTRMSACGALFQMWAS